MQPLTEKEAFFEGWRQAVMYHPYTDTSKMEVAFGVWLGRRVYDDEQERIKQEEAIGNSLFGNQP